MRRKGDRWQRWSTYTSVLLHVRRISRVLLAVLHRDGAVHVVAAVDLQALLIGAEGHLDAGLGAAHGQDG